MHHYSHPLSKTPTKLINILIVGCLFSWKGLGKLVAQDSGGKAQTIIMARQVEKIFPFGQLEVDVLEKLSPDKADVDIRIAVRKGERISGELVFKQTHSNGGYAGVSVARRTILDGYFLMQKVGGYDDRLIVVTDKGKIFNVPDGDVFYAPASKLLFAIRSDEVSEPAFTVVDLKDEKNIVSLEGKDCRKIFDEGFVYIMTEVDGSYLAEAYRNLGSKDPKTPEEARFVVFNPRDKTVKRYDKISDVPLKERKQVTELVPLPAMGDTAAWVPVR